MDNEHPRFTPRNSMTLPQYREVLRLFDHLLDDSERQTGVARDVLVIETETPYRKTGRR